jgi:hypothetical protein
MPNRLRLVLSSAALCLALGAGPALARPRTVRVDCARGERIHNALQREARELLVEIRGLCVEDVLVERDNVTLRGSDAAVDGIQSTDSGRAALTVRRSRAVRAENLTLVGAAALSVDDGRLDVSACHINGHGSPAALVNAASFVGFEDTDLSADHGAALWVLASTAVCRRCHVAGLRDPYAVLIEGSVVSFDDSDVSGGVFAEHASNLSLSSCALAGTPDALAVGVDGAALLNQGTLEGAFQVAGGHLTAFSVRQTANPGQNRISSAGYVELVTGFSHPPNSLLGTTSLERFGRLVATDGAALGSLSCASGADAWCDASVTKDSSSCTSCR